MRALAAAGGLTLSVGVIGVVVWTGAAGAEWTESTAEDCTSTSLSAPASEASETASSEPTATDAPTTTTTEPTSSEAPPASTSSSADSSCETSAPSSTTSPSPSSTTPRSNPSTTTQPPAETASGGGGGEPATTTTTPRAVQPAAQTSQQPVQNNATVRPLELREPHQAQVPAGGVLPVNGLLPEGALPPGATHVPEFGLLGPDPKALTAHSMSAGEATALPDREAPRAPELVAVGLIAIVAGLLARMIGPRLSRRGEG